MISSGFGLTTFATRRLHRGATPGGAVSFDFSTGSLPPGFGLTRASSGTVFSQAAVMKSKGVDTPRFGIDPITGASGLLLESEATNVVPYAAVSTTGWYASGAMVTDLSLSALSRFSGCRVASNGANWHRHTRNISMIAGAPYVMTLYLRAGSSGRLLIQFKRSNTAISAVSGPIENLAISANSFGAPEMRENRLMADGLTRVITLALTPNEGGTVNLGLGPDSVTPGEDVVLLACQVEQGDNPTSLIEANGAPLLRAADILVQNGFDGVFDLDVIKTDTTLTTLRSMSLVSGTAMALPRGRISSITLRPVV